MYNIRKAPAPSYEGSLVHFIYTLVFSVTKKPGIDLSGKNFESRPRDGYKMKLWSTICVR